MLPFPVRQRDWYHCQRSNPVGITPLLRSDMIFGRHTVKLRLEPSAAGATSRADFRPPLARAANSFRRSFEKGARRVALRSRRCDCSSHDELIVGCRYLFGTSPDRWTRIAAGLRHIGPISLAGMAANINGQPTASGRRMRWSAPAAHSTRGHSAGMERQETRERSYSGLVRAREALERDGMSSSVFF